MQEKIIFSLDIGSSKITALVASLGETPKLLGLSTYYFTNNQKGNDFILLNNGLVSDMERLSAKIMQVLHEAQLIADCSTGSVITNITGSHLKSIYNQTMQELNGLTVSEDVVRSMVATGKQIKLPNDYQILDYEVQEYLIDNEYYAINPLGLTVNTISANLNLLITGSIALNNLKKTINHSGFDVARVIPASVLSSASVLNSEEKELGVCLIDIGAGTTDIIVYENGFIRHLMSIPLGGEDITRDIASVFKLSRNLAEDLKLSQGRVSSLGGSGGDIINLIDHRGESLNISKRMLSEVIEERLFDIFKLVKKELLNNQLQDIINSGIVITGGVSLLPGIRELSTKYFENQVKIGVPNYGGEYQDIITNPRYATSVGGLYFANQLFLASDLEDSESGKFSILFDRMLKFFKGA